MSERLQSFNYEVVVPRKTRVVGEGADAHEVEVRKGQIVATGIAVNPDDLKPTRAAIIDKHWDGLKKTGITPGTVGEVEVRICPFCDCAPVKA